MCSSLKGQKSPCPVISRFMAVSLLFLLTLPLGAQHFSNNIQPDELARQLTSVMTDQLLLGQVLMFGWDSNLVEDETLDWIDLGLGSLKIFGWNGRDNQVLAETVGSYQQQALQGPYGIPLFIATDQEGGWVRHVTGRTSVTPGNMAIGASGRAYDSYTSSKLIAQELRILGVNMNFAPDVDLYGNWETSIVSSRAFSSDPHETAWLANAWFHGQQDSGIIATAKHFPGHGFGDKDSHGGLPVINRDLETLMAADLVPYEVLIQQGIHAIMVGHLAFPLITGEPIPASRSHFFLTELLRHDMGYKGLVITDDMIMQGARQGDESLPELCELSLKAGADLILISRSSDTHRRIWNYLLMKMQEDGDFKNRVRESAYRVIRIKAMDLKGPNAVPIIPEQQDFSQLLPHGDMRNFNLDLAYRSATQLRGEGFQFSRDDKILVVSEDRRFAQHGETYFNNADFLLVPGNPQPGELTAFRLNLKSKMQNYDRIIISYSGGREGFLLDELEPWADKITVVLTRNPYWIFNIPWCRSALATYMDSDETIEVAMAILAGNLQPQGILPLKRGDHF
jgi:beta-N-acetylhexosaminidase